MKPVYFFNPSYEERNINFYNLGLISIASHLKRKGIPSYVYMNYLDERFTKDKDYDLVLEAILKEKPQYIGISCMTTQLKPGLDLAHRIKEVSPQMPIVFGGVHITAYASDVLEKYTDVDYCVMGFGEIASEELYINTSNQKHIMQGSPLLSYEYPMDYSTVVKYTPVERAMRGRMVKQASIITSYGCPYRCQFCVNAIEHTPLIYRGVDAVVNEIQQVLKLGANSVAFYDELFFVKGKRIEELFTKLEETPFPWLALSRIDTIPKDLVPFRKRGCEEIHFGVESGSQRVIDEIINKKIKVANVIPTFQRVLDADILPRASFIIGMPGETIEDVSQTIYLMMEMAEKFSNHFVINTFFYYPIPNTPMTVDAFKGLTIQDCIDANKYASVHPYQLFKHFDRFYDWLPNKKFFAECWYIARIISEICAPYKYYESYKPDFKEWGLSVSQETYDLLNKDKLSQKWLDKVKNY